MSALGENLFAIFDGINKIIESAEEFDAFWVVPYAGMVEHDTRGVVTFREDRNIVSARAPIYSIIKTAATPRQLI